MPIEWLIKVKILLKRKKNSPKVKRLQNFENIVASIEIGQCLVQLLEIGVVNMLENERFYRVLKGFMLIES